MTEEVFEGDKYRNFTATTTVENNGNLLMILVASSSGGTIRVSDTQGTIVNTMAVVGGSPYPMPCKWRGTLTITVTGTLDATVFYKK